MLLYVTAIALGAEFGHGYFVLFPGLAAGVSPLAWWGFGSRGRTVPDLMSGVSLTVLGRAIA